MKYLRFSLLAIMILVVVAACSPSTPTNTPTPQSSGVSGIVPQPSGLIDSVTMAKGTQGATMDPANPTMVFANQDTFHAVAHTNNAPTGTEFKAIWYAVSIGSSSGNNQTIDSKTVSADGTVNIDFTLAPASTWPTGTYQVEIYVNGTLDQVVNFSVQ